MPPKIPFLKEEALKPPQSTNTNKITDKILSKEQVCLFISNLEQYISDETLKKKLRENFKRQFFSQGQLREELSDIKIIYAKWQALGDNERDKNIKSVVANKLTEGIDTCRAGYIFRIMEVVSFLEDQFTIEHILQKMRTTLVQKKAYSCNQGVHTYNDFLLAAAPYGVNKGNITDKYKSKIPKKKIRDKIRRTMLEQYQPLPMLDYVLRELEVQLRREYEYKGKLKDPGYEVAAYTKMRKVVQYFLCEKSEFSHYDLFLTNEDYQTLDINWPFLRFRTFEYLDCHFFNLPDTVKACIDYLLNPQKPDKKSIRLDALWVENPSSQKFIKNHRDFTILLNLTTSHEKQKQLFNNYIKHCVHEEQTISFYKILFEEATDNVSPRLLARLVKPLAPRVQADICNRNIKSLVTMLPVLGNDKGTFHSQRMLLEAFLIDKRNRPETIVSLYHNERCKDLRPQLAELFAVYSPKIHSDDLIKSLKKNETGKIDYYLKCIPLLPIKKQAALLKKENHDGCNALIMALSSMPENHTRLLLEILSNLDTQDKIKILKQTDNRKRNAWMAAVAGRPEFIRPLLALISTLPPQAQTEILSSTTNNIDPATLLSKGLNNDSTDVQLQFDIIKSSSKKNQSKLLKLSNDQNQNILMTALCRQQDILRPLLTLVDAMPPAARRDFLTKTDRDGHNFLTLTIDHCPPAITVMLEMIGDLSGEDQAEILTQSSSQDGRNALMKAMCNSIHPSDLDLMFHIIGKLPGQDKAEFLTQIDEEGSNCLMLAIRRCPEAIIPVLKLMDDIPIRDKAEIFQQATYKNGCNALMRACLSTRIPAADIEQLLRAITNLPFDNQTKIYEKTNKHGQNIIMIAINEKPELLHLFLDALKKLKKRSKTTILQQTDHYGFTSLMTAAACYEPKGLDMLLEFISKLYSKQQGIILEQTSNTNSNVLIEAAHQNQKMLKSVMQSIKFLDKEKQIAIIEQETKTGRTAITFEQIRNTSRVSIIQTYLLYLKGIPFRNKKMAIEIVSEDGKELQYLHPSLQRDIDVVLTALGNNKDALGFVDEILTRNDALKNIALKQRTSERLQAIQQYTQTNDYIKHKILAGLHQYAFHLHIAIQDNLVKPKQKLHLFCLFRKQKSCNSKETIHTTRKIIDTLEGKDVLLTPSDTKIIQKSELKNILYPFANFLSQYPNLRQHIIDRQKAEQSHPGGTSTIAAARRQDKTILNKIATTFS